jgi:glucose/arabinose dehydrogenase
VYRRFSLVGAGVVLALLAGLAGACGPRVPANATPIPAEMPTSAPRGSLLTPGDYAPLKPGEVQLVETFTGIRGAAFGDRPVFLTVVPGDADRLAVVNQGGTIVTFANDPAVDSFDVLLDISDRVSRDGNEEGLLGLAFAPDSSDKGEFYVYYSAADPRRSVLSRFKADGVGHADASTESVVLEIPQPFSNHNGGMIAFGSDGMLYVGVGDGGSAGDPNGNGQNPNTLPGSILRINPRTARQGDGYSIPPTNPFVQVSGGRPEVWAYGLRNPWRFSFDPQTGDLWVGDVGQGGREEINLVERGGNYGWNRLEGSLCFAPKRGCDTEGVISPLAEYDHTFGCSITGGHEYGGKSIEWLRGIYVYGDFCSGRIWALKYFDGRGVAEPVVVSNLQLVDTEVQITSFGEDADGELYVTGFDGGVYKIVAGPE